jgi:hypothetical protein
MHLWAVLLIGLVPLERPPQLLNGAKPEVYAAWLTSAAREKQARHGGACSDMTATPVGARRLDEDSPEPDVIERMKSGAQASAVFLEQVRVEGCGQITNQNLIVLPKPDGTWLAWAAMPGDTLAPLGVQLNTLRDLQPVIQAGSDCPDAAASYRDIQLLSRPRSTAYPLSAGDAWTERWPISICGRDISVDVTFTPTPGGRIADSIKPAPTNSLAAKPR